MQQHIYRRKSNRRSVTLALIVLVFLAVIISVRSTQLEVKSEEYAKKQEELQTRVDAEKQRTEDLNEYQEYVKSDEFKEWAAKNKLGLVKKDELVLRKNK